MKIKSLFATLFAFVVLFVACEEDNVTVNSELSDDIAALIADEVLSDINFADLLDEGDDGMFWGDSDFVMLKSAEVEQGTCPAKQVVDEDEKRIVTKIFSGEDCGKEGKIIIEYFKPNDDNAKKKNIFYIDFIKDGITYNGTKEIVKGNDNYNIKGDMVIDKVNSDGDSVHVTRDYQRQVHWLCGLDTRKVVEDNIKKVTGRADVTRTVNGEERSFTRQILEPLLIVKACDLKIQAGVVKITKADGTIVKIDYGQMPDAIDCESDFECDNTFEVTKGDEIYQMELVDGKRVRVVNSEE